MGEDLRPLERVVRAEFRPHVVLAGGSGDVPLLEGRTPGERPRRRLRVRALRLPDAGDRARGAGGAAPSVSSSPVSVAPKKPEIRRFVLSRCSLSRVRVENRRAAAACLGAPAAHAHLLDHPAPPAGAPAAPPQVALSGGQGAKWEFVATIPRATPTPTSTSSRAAGTRSPRSARSASAPTAAGRRSCSSPRAARSRRSFVVRPPVGVVRQQPERRARPPARRRGVAQGQRDPQHRRPRGRPARHADHRRRHRRRRAAATTRASVGLAERAAGRPRDRRRHRPGRPGDDRADQPHRRGAHGERRPQAPAHRLRRDLRQRSRRRRGQARQRDERAWRLDGFEVVDLSSCMNFPAGHRRSRRSARPAGPRSTATATRAPTWRSATPTRARIYGCHELEVYPDDRLTCAQRRGDDRARHEGRVRRPRHAGRLLRRQAARHAAALPGARLQLVGAVRHGREGHRLRRRRGRRDRRPDRVELARGRSARRWRACAGSAARSTWAARAHRRRPARSTRRQDIDFDHEAELTASRPLPPRHRRARRRRHCRRARPAARASTTRRGNGGIHAYRADALLTRTPSIGRRGLHARTRRRRKGERAIFRAAIRTGPQA